MASTKATASQFWVPKGVRAATTAALTSKGSCECESVASKGIREPSDRPERGVAWAHLYFLDTTFP